MKNYDDPGPIVDAVVWHDGAVWRAALDTTELHAPWGGAAAAPAAAAAAATAAAAAAGTAGTGAEGAEAAANAAGAADASAKGALADHPPFAAFRLGRQWGTFSARDCCNYALNVYSGGDVLSIVVDSGAHGTHVSWRGRGAGRRALFWVAWGAGEGLAAPTRHQPRLTTSQPSNTSTQTTATPRSPDHDNKNKTKQPQVAGIAAAHFPDDPAASGVAPGAQIISCKIGDTRLGSMETGSALTRAAAAVLQHGAQLVNMSFGEPTAAPGRGRVIDVVTELVEKHDVIFVASAGELERGRGRERDGGEKMGGGNGMRQRRVTGAGAWMYVTI